MRRDSLLVFALIASLAIGCDSKTSPAPNTAPTPVAVVKPPAQEAPPPAVVESEQPAESASQDGSQEEAAGAPETPPVDKPPEKPADEGAVERVAVLTPGGPVILDARISLDGQPHAASLDRLVEEVLAAADSDGDGRATWTELAYNDKFLEGKLAESERRGTYLLTMWIELHDTNADSRVQAEEAASWLGRNAGRTARAFALRTSRAYSPDPRLASRVWPLVDADADGALSADELAGAADRLWSLDANDDRVIAPAELASLRDQLAGRTNPAPMVGNRAASRVAALHLEPKCDLERVDFILQDMYAPLQDIGPTSFPAVPELFGKLNTSGDEWLDRDELADLLTVEPHATLAVAFQQSPPDGRPAATVVVHSHAPEIAVLDQEHPDRVVLALGPTRLVVTATDMAPAPEAAQQPTNLERTQLRLMVHDQGDALFAELDADSSGALSEREIATAPQRLQARDDDGDGRIASAELPYPMIVAFLRGEALNRRGFYTPTPAATTTGAANGPGWFTYADLNQDGDVSRREFVGSTDQFTTLDANADGYVDATEAAGTERAAP